MKAVILAGGLGTRLSEETDVRPKPMVEIGGRPILWHIMKMFSSYGHNEFIVCLGYKGYQIKEWFSNYMLHNSDVTIDLRSNRMEVHQKHVEDWRITLVDTGINTQTGGRIRNVRDYVGGTFMMTYGDGVGDVDMRRLLDFHKGHGKLATVTAVQPQGRFGVLSLGGSGNVEAFSEKVDNADKWVNGGFFVLEPGIFDYIGGEDTNWEADSLVRLSRGGQLMAYRHGGFWKAMDTLRDRRELEAMWESGKARWKTW